MSERDARIPVAFCAGLGVKAGAWAPVERRIDHARFMSLRVQRPGLDDDTVVRRVPTLSGEIERIAGVVGDVPAVVVGHSFGGFFAEAFARTHPELVRGLVLVDASVEFRHPDPAEQFLHFTSRRARRLLRQMPVTTRVAASVAELEAYLPAADDLVALRRRLVLPDVPVEVLTDAHAAAWPWGRTWLATQRRYAAMLASSPPGRTTAVNQRNVTDGTHLMMLSAPGVVATAIENAVGPARQPSSSSPG